MTGFGRAALRAGAVAYEVEARSVNHRYLDVRMRLPKPLAALEPELRARIQTRFARGKLDVNVVNPESGSAPAQLEIDVEIARQYARAAAELCDGTAISGTLDVGTLLTLPGVARLAEPELSLEELGTSLSAALDSALTGLDEMRAVEGAALERELRERLERVEAIAAAIDSRSETVQAAVRERLRKRAAQLEQETGLLDQARLHQEVVIAADRLDVTEELVRLRSHVEQFRSILAQADRSNPVGRRLDFLLQELGREANTIGSKCGDAPIAHDVVELKTELERLREQVQNVE
jgi:uncharacterized protein (TIGR00255 family)